MPSRKHDLRVTRITNEVGRQRALHVMRSTYRDEKNWIQSDDRLVDLGELQDPSVSWFVAEAHGEPVGVLRVLYEPPLELYAEYGFKLIARDLDLDAFIRDHRIAEIGRFAVVPAQRKNVLVSAALMRDAVAETVSRGFTHYITDVFEGEQHSPLEFHTRVLGFQVVATHEVGELNCSNRRITMVLDLKQCYWRLRASGGWLIRYLTDGWTEEMHRAMGNSPATVAAA
ncbi:MAG TPA: GNAT family N-acetyltransferase [Verrucomicrobiota bacterium]|nr:GNAT family N-acetyltransferase [Verrucomicrobiales bacterium]HRI12995.1 GNAT family N-acetyltransferase [Verrucomicrobiota bacterium]